MLTIRRWYLFLVCAVSLQSITWASISLFRNLLSLSDFPAQRGEALTTALSFQIAVIIIGLPFFLVHWIWAQRLARREPDENHSTIRRLYLYGMLAGFLVPFLANAFSLSDRLLLLVFGETEGFLASFGLSPTQSILHNLVAMGLLAVLWYFHQLTLATETTDTQGLGYTTVIRRWYILGFSGAGLTLTTLALIHLLRWIMFQFGESGTISQPGIPGLTLEVARLVVGLPLWLIFWGKAQRLYASDNQEEKDSSLRKFYLYVTVFVAVLGAVSNATLILAGVFRRFLGLSPSGDFRFPLPIIIAMIVLWAYHAYILREDAAQSGEAPRQSGVRRLYLYLVAAVGLGAFLVGLSGDISVVIRSLSGEFFGDALKEQLVWFTAALISGLPVWLLPWRQVQAAAVNVPPAGVEERLSIVRKIYLYFFLFAATMAVLSSTVYIVYRLLSLAMGERVGGPLLIDLGQAIAFTLIGLGIWLYHGLSLRSDGQLNRQERAQRLEELSVVVVDTGEGTFGEAVTKALQRELPGLKIDCIHLASPPADTQYSNQESFLSLIAQAKLIVGPWFIAIAGGANGAVTAEIARAIAFSPALKLLIPFRSQGWEWVSVDRRNNQTLVQQTVRTVRQLAEGGK